MTYVLIIIFFGNGSAVTTQEFSSKASCEAAVVAVRDMTIWTNIIKTACVPK